MVRVEYTGLDGLEGWFLCWFLCGENRKEGVLEKMCWRRRSRWKRGRVRVRVNCRFSLGHWDCWTELYRVSVKVSMKVSMKVSFGHVGHDDSNHEDDGLRGDSYC